MTFELFQPCVCEPQSGAIRALGQPAPSHEEAERVAAAFDEAVAHGLCVPGLVAGVLRCRVVPHALVHADGSGADLTAFLAAGDTGGEEEFVAGLTGPSAEAQAPVAFALLDMLLGALGCELPPWAVQGEAPEEAPANGHAPVEVEAQQGAIGQPIRDLGMPAAPVTVPVTTTGV